MSNYLSYSEKQWNAYVDKKEQRSQELVALESYRKSIKEAPKTKKGKKVK